MASRSASNKLKYLSLIIVTLQNAILGLSMRYARTRPGDMFLSSTAVGMAEVVKLLTSLALVFMEEGKNVDRLKAALHNTIVKQPIDTLKILYILQNNLLYVSAPHLYAATYLTAEDSDDGRVCGDYPAEETIPHPVGCPGVAGHRSGHRAAGADGFQWAAASRQQQPGEPDQNRLLVFSAALGERFYPASPESTTKRCSKRRTSPFVCGTSSSVC